MPLVSRKLALATVALCTLGAAPAVAQSTDMSARITCLGGSVAPNDYSELDQNMAESGWDTRAYVSVVAETGGLVLDVRDNLGNSVCEREANNSTTCSLRIDRTVNDTYTIRVENYTVPSEVSFRICAY